MTDVSYIEKAWAEGRKVMHWRDGIGFERLTGGNEGDVRITQGERVVAEIPAAEWASLIHYLATATGTQPGHASYEDARRFHAA